MLRVTRVTFVAFLISFAVAVLGQQAGDGPPDRRDQDDSISQQDAPAKQVSSVKKEREAEVSSSKDTRVDLSPPAGDDKKHPQSGTTVMDAEDASTDVQEMHAWDPHKA